MSCRIAKRVLDKYVVDTPAGLHVLREQDFGTGTLRSPHDQRIPEREATGPHQADGLQHEVGIHGDGTQRGKVAPARSAASGDSGRASLLVAAT